MQLSVISVRHCIFFCKVKLFYLIVFLMMRTLNKIHTLSLHFYSFYLVVIKRIYSQS